MSSQLAELDQRARSLQERQHLGEIGEISRGLAHTLRNPLNALGLSVEELASGGSESGELAESARRQIRRIDQGIRSFLVLASQGGGAVAEVDAAGMVQDVALEALQDSPGRVRLDLEGVESPRPLEAVEPELRAVVQALLVNACEASPEGGRVAVRLAEAGEGRLRLEIEDEGPGIPPEVRDRLFTPHLTTKANGSGMGLFLAHRIATGRYGGTLELLEAPGGGTLAVLEIGDRRDEISGEAA
jgi:signal transduction histidine kinase